jgi:hypothetical protein
MGSTEPFWIGINPDSAQVKSIGIPAGNDRGQREINRLLTTLGSRRSLWR